VAGPIPTLSSEIDALRHGPVVGIDEVGRGALAGPVCVGAVLLTSARPAPEGLTDSKLLTPRRRAALVQPLEAWADAWSIGEASAAEIDAWGIRLALAVAADRALRALSIHPSSALIDGNLNLLRPPVPLDLGSPVPDLAWRDLPVRTIVKGDQHSVTIAAAAVLAKEYRDALMTRLDPLYPAYGFAGHKGYGAASHQAAIAEHGPSDVHRQTWRLTKD
jgi:ribonuclease HII